MPTLTLSGCAPVPLAHYLKALGVLRILSIQSGDPIQGCWVRNEFVLTTSLGNEDVLNFFENDYQPTPIAVPWSGGDFFNVDPSPEPKKMDKCPTSSRVIEAVLATTTERLGAYRETLRVILKAMNDCEVTAKKTIEGNGGAQRAKKAELLRILRNRLPDEALAWIDAAAVIEDAAPYFNPMLGGGGGSDGNSHFSDNFMQSLWMTLSDFSAQREKPVSAISGTPFNARAALAEALFSTNRLGTKIDQLSPVLFDSTRVGGPNQKSGFEAKAGSNPWDFILMLEGVVLFAGSLGRKLNDTGASSARFPFVLNSSPTGRGSSYLGESSGREAWLPLWSEPAGLNEIVAIMGEGRLEKHGRMARYGADAFVALAQFGHTQGIKAFQRVGFFKGRIGGDNYFTAVDQGVYGCHLKPSINALKDVDKALDRLRHAIQSEKCSNEIRRSVLHIDDAISRFATGQASNKLQDILEALGQVERALARSHDWAQDTSIRPFNGLQTGWLDCPDSIEFRLACSLAGLTTSFGQGKERLEFRQHLEPLKRSERGEVFRPEWSELSAEGDVTWQEGNLTDSLNAILARRIQRVEKAGVEGWPDRSHRYARLEDITAFIENRTDDVLLADLIWGLSLLDWQAIRKAESATNETASDQDNPSYHWHKEDMPPIIPSSFYALLKLCFRPKWHEKHIPLVPAIHQRARIGDGVGASRLAARRLLASGEAPLVRELRVSSDVARRTAAALLFPIHPRDIKLLKLTTQHSTERPNI